MAAATNKISALLLLLVTLTSPCNTYTLDNVKNLRTTLFTGYSKELRPIMDSSVPLMVSTSMWLTSIEGLDELSQTMTITALLMLEWEDPQMVWDPTAHNGTDFLTYPQKEVWLPDLTIRNSVDSVDQLGFDRNYVYIRPSGWVIWMVRDIFRVTCDVDVTYYPFDTQNCDVRITTLVSLSSHVDMEASVPAVFLDWYGASGSWELLGVTATRSNDGTRSQVTFTIQMRRLRVYYVMTVIIPVVFLSLTATLVFALPADSGEKMGTAITVLLAFAVYLTIVADQMPKTSLQVSILAIYLTTLLGLTSSGVLLTVWILNLHHRDDAAPPGRRTQTLVRRLERLMCKGRKPTTVSPAESKVTIQELDGTREKDAIVKDQRNRNLPPDAAAHAYELPAVTWRHVAFITDRALFYFFSIFLVASTTIFMTIFFV